MDTHRIEAMGHQVKGAMKETLGRLIGDAKLESDGATERALGAAQHSADQPMIPGIDQDRVSGVGHQFKGEVKRGLGEVFGDPKLVADGLAEQRAGVAQDAAGSARDEANDTH
jgi:uncharacterized protein YjbJ (UPF0337 family)